MSGDTFTFNGANSADMGLVLEEITEPFRPPRTLDIQSVPGRGGGYLMGAADGPMRILLVVRLKATDDADARDKIEAIAAWLSPTTPCSLILSNRADRQWFALLDGDTSLDRMLQRYRTTLTFTCPDPRCYATNETATAIVAGENTIVNTGVIPARPRFVLPFTSAATFARLEHADGRYVQIGSPAQVTETPVAVWTSILADPCTSLASWVVGTSAEGGAVAGTMIVDGSAFTATDFGSGSTIHGPTRRRVLSSPLTDFKAKFLIGQDNRNSNALGWVEVYLLNAAHQVIGKVQLADKWTSTVKNVVSIRAGGASAPNHAFLTDYPGAKAGDYNNLLASIEISRIGNVWSAYCARVDGTGKHTQIAPITPWTDTAGDLDDQLAEIEVRIGKWSTSAVATSHYIADVAVDGYAAPQPTDVVYVVRAGDVLEFDFDHAVIRRNGRAYLTYFDAAGSDFYALDSGPVEIKVLTDGTVSGAAAYVRPGWR